MRLEWAAADLGASPRQAIRHIILPLIAPAILAGTLICVTLSIDEFVITWFTVGNQPTLPTYIYTQDQVRGHARGQRRGHGHARRHPADLRDRVRSSSGGSVDDPVDKPDEEAA